MIRKLYVRTIYTYIYIYIYIYICMYICIIAFPGNVTNAKVADAYSIFSKWKISNEKFLIANKQNYTDTIIHTCVNFNLIFYLRNLSFQLILEYTIRYIISRIPTFTMKNTSMKYERSVDPSIEGRNEITLIGTEFIIY